MSSLRVAEAARERVGVDVVERHHFGSRAAAEQVERCVYGGAGQVCFRIARQVVFFLSLNQAQKDGLQDVLSIGGAARDALGSAKNASVMRLKEAFQRGGRFSPHCYMVLVGGMSF